MKAQLAQRQEWIRGRRQKRKLARMARLRRQVLRYFLLTVLLASGVAGFACLPWIFADPLADCQIHGNKVVSDEQVRATVKGFAGKSLLRLDPRRLESAVSALPAVRYAFVRRYLFPAPHLVVEVMEEFPWATFTSSPDTAPEGVIAETGKYVPVSEFPCVVQPALKVCGARGMRLSAAQIAQWDAWAACIAAQTGQAVDLIDLRQPAAIQVRSGDLCLHIGAADSTLTRRLGRLSSVMPVLSSVRNRMEYVDLSLDSNIPLKVSKTPIKPDASHATRHELSANPPLPNTLNAQPRTPPATPGL